MSDKLKFSVMYLAIATVVLLVAVTVFYSLWYPHPLLLATGTQKLLQTIALVNIGLAVGLALMIFRKTKPDFIKDMVISALVQLIFLMISIYGVYQIRPIWIAYNVDRFELVLHTDLVTTKINDADNRFKKPSYLSPQYVGVELSADNEERNSNMFDEVLHGISIAQRPERYIPIEQVSTQIKERAQDLVLLEKYNNKNDVQFLLKKYPQADSFVPLQAKAVNMTVLLNKSEDNQVVAIVDLRPW
ncbi:type IV pilin accessory protein [Psychrobacter sp. 4Dc]|uniref:TfpX/TfpZ family type IV pilin accessory protein n=1 Tax=Psychrobacter sp. 4Dc TaxID=888437 RepID=UPI000CAE461C|nr:TfpX/TfpZ family type IV pilin accessory protein [Psychrobacter sp. 4Dc]PKH64309.1 type IV pilin accessory protein [Psychrobacter sp. 4Dc]